MLPPEVSVPAAPSGKPITRASQPAVAFSSRTAPGAAGAKPEYLLAAAARKSPSAAWNRPPPGI